MVPETPRDDYTPPDAKTVGELMQTKEGEDEAMARYKASLLGAAAAGGGKSNDPRRVVITELTVVVSHRQHHNQHLATTLTRRATVHRASFPTTLRSCSICWTKRLRGR